MVVYVFTVAEGFVLGFAAAAEGYAVADFVAGAVRGFYGDAAFYPERAALNPLRKRIS